MKPLPLGALLVHLAAAFIGPGHGDHRRLRRRGPRPRLLWALGFSVVATLVLLEAAARLTIVSGGTWPRPSGSSSEGHRASLRLLLVLGAIVVGNAAYEAGNILGAVAGVGSASDLPPGS
jgi:manganese transport protein